MNMWISDFLYDNRETEIYQKDIEAEFFINRATASKMLALMEEKQLIRRIVSEKDARLKKMELLPKGYELHEVCVVIREEIENKLTQTLSSEEVEIFRFLCRRMIANMER
ncbi:MAG: MarR family winged helix-turn-helix transcriptional regulator [Candidatus Fimousia sp.]|nr:MarR family transcriptional regulator [Anaerostipes sp.]